MLQGVTKYSSRRALLRAGAAGVLGLGVSSASRSAAAQTWPTNRVGGSRRVHIDGVLDRVPGSGGPARLAVSVTVDGPEDALCGSGWTMAPPPVAPAVPVAPIYFTQVGVLTGDSVKLVGRGLFSSIVPCVGAEIEVTAGLVDGFITFRCMCVDPSIPDWRLNGVGTVVHD